MNAVSANPTRMDMAAVSSCTTLSCLVLVVFGRLFFLPSIYVGFVTKKRRRKKYDERRHQRSHRSALAASSMFSVLHVPFTMHSLLASIHCRANTCRCILFPVSCSFRLLSLCLLLTFSLSLGLSRSLSSIATCSFSHTCNYTNSTSRCRRQ